MRRNGRGPHEVSAPVGRMICFGDVLKASAQNALVAIMLTEGASTEPPS